MISLWRTIESRRIVDNDNRNGVAMDEKPKKHQFVHVSPVEEPEDTEENKCFNEGSENDGDDTVPLGLTGKAVCMQVCSTE